MITDIDFEAIFQAGKPWPPTSEANRIARYERETDIWAGEHSRVWGDALRKLRGDKSDVLRIILDFPKRLSTLWGDLLIGEPPIVNSDNDDLPQLLDQIHFWESIYLAIIDISRHGNAVVKVGTRDETVEMKLVPVRYWYPVVSQTDQQEVLGHMLAYTFSATASDTEKKETYLRCEIHNPGSIEYRTYLLTGSSGNQTIVEAATFPGLENYVLLLEDGARDVYVLSNLRTSEDGYGMSDYGTIESLVQELEMRYSHIARVIDMHGSPSMQGPFEPRLNPITGEREVIGGSRFFSLLPGDPPYSYLEWGGQMTAAFEEIQRLANDMYTLSETCPEAFGQAVGQNGPLSGTAIAMRLLAPRAKARRMAMCINSDLLDLIRAVCRLAGLPVRDISLTWQDGLPSDPTEAITRATMAFQAKGMSLETYIRITQELSPEQVQEEMQRIQAEQASAFAGRAPTIELGPAEEGGEE
jgi:hypothetical protein